ncbi:HAD family hydrolase [Goodfellowiella coeruleoviolacea]|uniref:Phosphoglycolate phosphatase, HAD superfamily n=1 Tax=Goodfellowiella coeruleoviolacea TaxID=334858 RepID=A0AAE3GK13_9PSEU|nr:haloacid dehalogenase-like hydrolase [Goodfellowiella coeruleoviolacea]MCP2169631.1 Phosphoglycolate phosphatase, HAD superfamily [Goodfellowiella coeruleoviolacea]
MTAPPPPPSVLVLWDIDLTLVNLTGLGQRWYAQALTTVSGLALRHLPAFPGRTERAITRELLTAHGEQTDDETIKRVYAALISIATEDRHRLSQLGHALPGASEALTALAARPTVVQSLVTGNLPEIARYKLAAFGLDANVEFDIGGYGSLSEHRPDLVSAAVRNAADKYGVRFGAGAVVVIGDSPHDVTAALHHGAVAVGVATGHSSEQELRDAGAHVTLPDLADTDAVVRAVLGGPGGVERSSRRPADAEA